MITIICNIIVMTIIIESTAVGGGIEDHQSHIHSVGVTQFKTVCHLRKPTDEKPYPSQLWKCLSE